MKKTNVSNQFIKTYWIHFLFVFFLVNFAITKSLQLTFFAQSCVTREMIANENRCLYIYANSVYEKGTRSSPHKGNPCGSDVTNILPSSHLGKMMKYLDPNYVAALCSNTVPSPTIAPQATQTPLPTMQTPQPTQMPQPTQTPHPTVSSPTHTPITIQPTLTVKPIKTIAPTPKVSATLQSSPTNSPEPTQTPPAVQLIQEGQTGFGKFTGGISNLSEKKESGSTGVLSPPSAPTKSQIWMSIVFWSELLTAGSFILLIVSVVLGGARQIVSHKKYLH